MSGQANQGHEQAAPDAECYWCRVPLDADGRCPECGRRQTRVCFCGEELYPDEDVCPACGSDWRGVVKVRRRKRRRSATVVDMLRYAGAGILVAVLLAALTNSAIGMLALRSAPGTQLPDSPGERLGLAWETIAKSVGAMVGAFLERMGGASIFVGFGLAGALIGVLYYLRYGGGLSSHHRREYWEDEPHRRRRT